MRSRRRSPASTRSVQAREYDQSIARFTDDCKFDAQSLATLKRSFIDLKLLDTVPDLKTTYTEVFQPKRWTARAGLFTASFFPHL